MFTGYALTDSGAMDSVAESVSAVITDISAHETPFLDRIGDAMSPATSIKHEFLEDKLAPNRLKLAAAVASTGADTAIAISSGLGKFIQPGTMLAATELSTQAGQTFPEYFRVKSIQGPNTIVVTRAYTGTVSSSYANGDFLVVIANASNEGADVVTDSSQNPTRLNNLTQIFKEDIIISGSADAVTLLGGRESQSSWQVKKKLKENLRNLEKAALLSRISADSGVPDDAPRSMRGLLQWIATNVKTYTTSVQSTAAQFEQDLLDLAELAWQNGGTDLNLMIAGPKLKRSIDQLNSSRIRVVNVDNTFGNNIWRFECAYGEFEIMLNRWMPASYAALVSTERIAMAPLKGRAMGLKEVPPTGDQAMKAMVLGEYTMELRNEAGMALGKWPNLGALYTP